MAHNHRFWKRVVTEAEGKERTHAEVAAQHGVTVSALRSWIYRLRRERAAEGAEPIPRLVPVRISTSKETPPSRRPVTIRMGRDLEIEIEEGTAPTYIAELVRALG